jgi:phosphoribosylamine---glycine ligase
MGAVSPLPFADDAFLQKVKQQVIEPTIAGLQKDVLDYKGFIFFGLMNDDGTPKVIEYNCRMGDPETEVVIPRIKNDFVQMLLATANKKLYEINIEVDERTVAAVVAVSGGYPGDYETGKEITGLREEAIDNSIVFHAGTKEENGMVFTNGGRVLVVTSFADTIAEAAEQSNYMLEQLFFEEMYARTDIGYEFK